MIYKFLIPLIFLSVFAYAGDIQTITLSNALYLAFNNNLDLKQAGKDLTIAQAQYDETFADFALPGITLGGNATLLDPLTVSNGIVTAPNSYMFISPSTIVPKGFSTISNVFPDNYSAGVTVSKVLFTGFRLWNLMEIKKMNLDLAKRKYEDQKKETVYETSGSFYNLAVLREITKLSEDLDKQLSNQLATVIINYRNGLASEYDRISAEVQYKNNLPKILQARDAYTQAKIALCNSIGVNDYNTVEFLGDLMDYTNVVLTNTSESNIMEAAASNSYNLLSLDYAVKTLELTKKVNEGNYYPTVSAAFSFQESYKRDFTETDRNWWPNWSAALQLTYALDSFIPISRTAKTSREFQETIDKTRFNRQNYLDSLRLQIKSLLLLLDQSRQNIVSQEDGLKEAKLGLKIANDQYRVGQASTLDLTDAETAYTQAMENYLQAVYTYFSSILQIKRLTE